MTNHDYTTFSSPTSKQYSSRCCDSFDHCYEFSSFPTDSVIQSTVNIPIDPPSRSSKNKTISKSVQKPAFHGPEVFGKVLGPTADESILVGLQAIMDMAGTLEFAGSFASIKETYSPPTTENTPCQTAVTATNLCSTFISPIDSPSGTSLGPETSTSPEICSSDEYRNEIYAELKRSHCPCRPHCPVGPIIITEENISASVQTSKRCQQSQTRVLPHSMVCYEQESASRVALPYKSAAVLPSVPCLRPIPSERELSYRSPRRPSPPPPSRVTKATQRTPSPCSKYFKRTTTISVIEPTQPIPPPSAYSLETCRDCEPSEPCERSIATSRASSMRHTAIEQIVQIKPPVRDAHLETDHRKFDSREISCSCDISPRSRAAESSHEVGVSQAICCSECACGTYHSCRNNSCACYLIPQKVNKADAAISALKVNTSCQYHKNECFPSETRSTQCEKKYPRSSTNLRSELESGDYFYPNRKRSLRMFSENYSCRNAISKCAVTTKRSSKLFIPPCDCEEIYKNRPGLEMGDIAISSPTEVRYAITKITKFKDFSTFEVMKSTSKKPKCIPKAVEGVFVLKKDESSSMY